MAANSHFESHTPAAADANIAPLKRVSHSGLVFGANGSSVKTGGGRVHVASGRVVARSRVRVTLVREAPAVGEFGWPEYVLTIRRDRGLSVNYAANGGWFREHGDNQGEGYALSPTACTQ